MFFFHGQVIRIVPLPANWDPTNGCKIPKYPRMHNKTCVLCEVTKPGEHPEDAEALRARSSNGSCQGGLAMLPFDIGAAVAYVKLLF